MQEGIFLLQICDIQAFEEVCIVIVCEKSMAIDFLLAQARLELFRGWKLWRRGPSWMIWEAEFSYDIVNVPIERILKIGHLVRSLGQGAFGRGDQ